MTLWICKYRYVCSSRSGCPAAAPHYSSMGSVCEDAEKEHGDKRPMCATTDADVAAARLNGSMKWVANAENGFKNWAGYK